MPDVARVRPFVRSDSLEPVGHHASESLLIVDPLDEIARHVGGTFVIVVESTGGRYRRRCYLTANAAERAARRATGRGENATVYLAELKPLWKVRGGDVG